jgi:hypothetical protein
MFLIHTSKADQQDGPLRVMLKRETPESDEREDFIRGLFVPRQSVKAQARI